MVFTDKDSDSETWTDVGEYAGYLIITKNTNVAVYSVSTPTSPLQVLTLLIPGNMGIAVANGNFYTNTEDNGIVTFSNGLGTSTTATLGGVTTSTLGGATTGAQSGSMKTFFVILL
jgi:hypothetical protein